MYKKQIDMANKYRQNGNNTGVVVLFNNEVCGWMDELRSPESWAPGAIAIDAENHIFIAEGGDDYDGSYRWIEQSTN